MRWSAWSPRRLLAPPKLRRGARRESESALPYLIFSTEPVLGRADQVPLVIFLHGYGERGGDVDALPTLLARALPKLADAGTVPVPEPVLIACPQTFQERWVDDATRVLRLVRELVATHRVDPDRCYLTGISMGGSGCWKIAAAEPSCFAAIVPVSGCAYPEQATATTPARVYHGKRDKVNKFTNTEKDLWAERNESNTQLIADPAAKHNAKYWNKVYADPELYNWMLAQ